MASSELVDRLAFLPELSGVPRDELQWLVDHGEVHRHDDGYTVFGSEAVTGLVLVIAGRFSVRVNQHGIVREVREVTPGRVTAHLPFSRMTVPRGYLVADGPIEFLFIPQQLFRDMTRACYEFTFLCVQEMLARARVFKSDDKHQEKMAALGQLSAGLAHELNNPTSAMVRSAGELEACMHRVADAARALGAANLDEASQRALRSLEQAVRPTREPLTPLERAALEEDAVEWLGHHGLDGALAYPLTDSGLTVAALDAAASAINPAHVPVVIRYVAASVAARGLSDDLLSAATRVHALVAAVKRHTHMDRDPAAGSISLRDHLEDTVALMRAKATTKTVSLDLSIKADLPAIVGSVGDLNQVWTHLIDNAIDAAAGAGRVVVEAVREREAVVVRVIDDGPGIPDQHRERIFDPFFTTKTVGQGRGLGLDVARTVVEMHKGTIAVSSRPGHTEFRVSLPISTEAE